MVHGQFRDIQVKLKKFRYLVIKKNIVILDRQVNF